MKSGAQIIDVCLQNADRDELDDIDALLRAADQEGARADHDRHDGPGRDRARAHVLPGQVDHQLDQPRGRSRSSSAWCRSRAAYGAALVVGCIDEDKEQGRRSRASASSTIARRSCKLLTEKYGIRPGDIIFDPLVFPCATGDENYVGSAVETIEGIRLIKQALPDAKTVLGISNVSFGLPDAGREVLNSVFLYHCAKAGLDLAIVNSEKLERYASIPEEERKLAEDLLWNRGDDPVAAFAAHFRGAKARDEEGRLDAAARRAARRLHHRGHEGRPRRRPRAEARRRRRRSTSSTAR